MKEPVSREALDSIPESLRGKACICPLCAQPTSSAET